MYLKRSGTGEKLLLAEEIGRGGEGIVSRVLGQPTIAAKVYTAPLSADRTAKLRTMVRQRSDRLDRLCAWPIDLVESADGSVVGFVMPRVENALEIHTLYGPTSRKREFPKVDMRGLLYAARNLAAVLAAVHENGVVVGDVNDRSVLVAQDMTVRLIDCDSFQVRNGGVTYTCDVGTPAYQPPELQASATFRGLHRTENHDNFGLAVQIFQLIYLGRHPYDGRVEGRDVADTAGRIAQNLFVYGANAARLRLRPPPHTLPLEHYGAELAGLFERAFDSTTNGQRRPIAREWADRLGVLAKGTLGRCKRNRAHFAKSGTIKCAVCTIDKTIGTELFSPPSGARPGDSGGEGFPKPAVSTATKDEIATLRTEMQTVRHATPDDLLLSVTGQVFKSTIGPTILRLAAMLVLAGALASASHTPVILIPGAIGVWILWSLSNGKERERVARRERLRLAEARYFELTDKWRSPANDGEIRIAEQFATEAERSLQNLEPERERLLRAARADDRHVQLSAHLRRFSIGSADIRQIGGARLNVLRSYGIETAADVSRSKLSVVPGIGPKRLQALLAWRYQQEMSFQYVEGRSLPKEVVNNVDAEYRRVVAKRVVEANKAMIGLRDALRTSASEKAQLKAEVFDAAMAVAQARADVALLA